jgi:hypothetical protein
MAIWKKKEIGLGRENGNVVGFFQGLSILHSFFLHLATVVGFFGGNYLCAILKACQLSCSFFE